MCKQISINYNYDTVIVLIYIGDLLSVVQVSVSHLSIYLSINISIYYLVDLSYHLSMFFRQLVEVTQLICAKTRIKTQIY